MVGQLATETGWSIDYILDLNVVMLALMTADMPHYVSPQKKDLMTQIREMEERERKRNSHTQTEEKPKGMKLALMTADMPHYVSPQKKDLMTQIREMEERERKRNSHTQTEEKPKGMNPMEFFASLKDEEESFNEE